MISLLSAVLAQSVELLICNQRVKGSSPLGGSLLSWISVYEGTAEMPSPTSGCELIRKRKPVTLLD